MEKLNWQLLAKKSLEGEIISKEEAHSILNCEDDSLLLLLDAAFSVRKKYFGKKVKLNFLMNAKSGLCPEDCSYCSQSKDSEAKINKYPFLSEKEVLAAAKNAVDSKAKRFCMVNSGRGPTDREIEEVASAIKKVKNIYPELEICVCLGLLKEHHAEQLKNAGVHAYNHNLNTSEDFYSEICSTHTFKDRVETVERVKHAGLSSCSGSLFGMGEKDEDIIELAFSLRKIGVDSIPINFLMAIPGTLLQGKNELTPQKCLKILCLFRLINPQSEIRIAGGREHHLRWLQPLGLYAANSIFIGDYLTTKGQKIEADIGMIRDLGFEIEGHENLENSLKGQNQVLEEFSVRLN